MYEIKTIYLKNKQHIKKRHTIHFHNEKMQIVAEFLMADLSLFKDEIIQTIEQILRNDLDRFTYQGNRTCVQINKDYTYVTDLLADFNVATSYPNAQVKTTLFKQLIEEWFEAISNE